MELIDEFLEQCLLNYSSTAACLMLAYRHNHTHWLRPVHNAYTCDTTNYHNTHGVYVSCAYLFVCLLQRMQNMDRMHMNVQSTGMYTYSNSQYNAMNSSGKKKKTNSQARIEHDGLCNGCSLLARTRTRTHRHRSSTYILYKPPYTRSRADAYTVHTCTWWLR